MFRFAQISPTVRQTVRQSVRQHSTNTSIIKNEKFQDFIKSKNVQNFVNSEKFKDLTLIGFGASSMFAIWFVINSAVIKPVNAKLDAFYKHLDAFDKKLDAFDKKLDTQADKLSKLTGEVSYIKGFLKIPESNPIKKN